MAINKLKYNDPNTPLEVKNINVYGSYTGILSTNTLGNFTFNSTLLNVGAGGTINIYKSNLSETNFERGKIGWSTNSFDVGTEKGSTGGNPTQFNLQTNGITRVAITSTGSVGIGTTQSVVDFAIFGEAYILGRNPFSSGTTLNIGGYATYPGSLNQDYTSSITFNRNSSGAVAYISCYGPGIGGPQGSLSIGGNRSGCRVELRSYNISNTARQNAIRLSVEEILGDIQILNTTNTTSATTGALQVSGGVGVASDLYVRLRAHVIDSVGIGTTIARTKLDVRGNALISGITTITNNFNVGAGGTIITTTGIGSVGIGSTLPTAKVDIQGGDIRVGVSNSNGLILTSPNGTRYRLIVDDAGIISTVLVT